MTIAAWEKKTLMISTATSVVLGFVLIPGSQGFGSVGIFLGLLLLCVAPLFLIATAQELVRSVRQTRRITGWAHQCDLRENTPKTAAQRRKRFWFIFKNEIFASYTTCTYRGRTFFIDPDKEAAHFAAQEAFDEELEAC